MSNGLLVEIMGIDADVIQAPKKAADISFEKFNGTGAAEKLTKRLLHNELADEILGDFQPVVKAQEETKKQSSPLFEAGEFSKIFTRAAAEAFTADLSKRRAARTEDLKKWDKHITGIVTKFRDELPYDATANIDDDVWQGIIDAGVSYIDKAVAEFGR
jgi:hypothetical protein